MVPVGIPRLVHLSILPLRPTARGVALKSESDFLDDSFLSVLDKTEVAHDVLLGLIVGIVKGEEPVPLVERDGEVNLGQRVHVPDVVDIGAHGIVRAEEDVIDGLVDVGDVDGVVIVDVAFRITCRENNVIDDEVDIGDVNIAITVSVATQVNIGMCGHCQQSRHEQ